MLNIKMGGAYEVLSHLLSHAYNRKTSPFIKSNFLKSFSKKICLQEIILSFFTSSDHKTVIQNTWNCSKILKKLVQNKQTFPCDILIMRSSEFAFPLRHFNENFPENVLGKNLQVLWCIGFHSKIYIKCFAIYFDRIYEQSMRIILTEYIMENRDFGSGNVRSTCAKCHYYKIHVIFSRHLASWL